MKDITKYTLKLVLKLTTLQQSRQNTKLKN